MPYELLIDGQFKKEFFKSLNSAKRHVELQFMTFEGDNVGLKVSGILKKLAKRGVDVRLIVDYFTDFWVSDTPVWKKEAKSEAKATKKMFRDLKLSGVKIRRTNKIGFLMTRFLRRNHKKIIVIDDAAFIGGFNISEHNFSWHDFMVKISGEDVKHLLDDFDYTWGNKKYEPKTTILTGDRLHKTYKKILLGAKKEILITSPYLIDKPTVDLFSQAAKNGVKIKILTLKKNNFLPLRIVKNCLINKLLRHGIEVYYYKKFSHGKCFIVDRKVAMFGSSNFGYYGHMTNEDVCMLSNNTTLIRSFEKKLFHKDFASSVRAGYENSGHTSSFIAGLLFMAFIKLYSSIIK